MKFNAEQKEGLAKIADNLATACIVAMIVGGLVDHKLGVKTVALLGIGFSGLIFVGLILRKGD